MLEFGNGPKTDGCDKVWGTAQRRKHWTAMVQGMRGRRVRDRVYSDLMDYPYGVHYVTFLGKTRLDA